MASYKKDLVGAYAEMLPELVLPIIDVFLMAMYGMEHSIAGVSVFHLVLTCLNRFIQPWNETVSEFASQNKERRAQVIALGVVTAPAILFFGTAVWLGVGYAEEWLGLPGFAEYGRIQVFGWVWIRLLVPCFIALGIHQVKIYERAILSWAICGVNALLTWGMLHMGGGAAEVGLATVIAELGYGVSAYWAVKEGIFRLPKMDDFDSIYTEMKTFYWVNLGGQVFKIGSTCSAIVLNKWLGPEIGASWVWIQEVNRVIISLGDVAWNMAGRHYRLNSEKIGKDLYEPTEASYKVWEQGAFIGWVIAGVAGCIGLLVSPLGVFCTIMGAGGTFYKQKRKKGKILADMKIVRKGEIANAMIMIVGYVGVYHLVQPSLWVAIGIYMIAHSMRVIINK